MNLLWQVEVARRRSMLNFLVLVLGQEASNSIFGRAIDPQVFITV